MLEKKLIIMVLLLILGVIPFSGCTNSNQTSNNLGPNAIAIQNMAFSPTTLTVKAGTTVKWTNLDQTMHDVTSDTGVFKSGNLTNGQSYNYTFNNTGNYPYHCAIHPSMTGTIVVQ